MASRPGARGAEVVRDEAVIGHALCSRAAAMLASDRALLRNLIIIVVASTGAGLAIGTSCLGRDRARPTPETSERDRRGSLPRWSASSTEAEPR